MKKLIKFIFAIAILCGLVAAIFSPNKNKKSTNNSSTKEESTENITTEETNEDTTKNGTLTLKHGELLEHIETETDGKKILVIKAKITSSYNNKATINQNYFNAADLVTDQGCSKYDEIQYWAVADMTNGEEMKVISFTMNADLIKMIQSDNFIPEYIGDYAEDLYILPSLLEEK